MKKLLVVLLILALVFAGITAMITFTSPAVSAVGQTCHCEAYSAGLGCVRWSPVCADRNFLE